ncbi:Pheophorbide a oxygenase, chloroplastic [Frankliniella fusca]|uniref:Pheophorbide a oxygenase, chloroplastic n=1 Tax=Frankliniella fusca TaxID=407009 RepID=A0AAE1GSU2_9NEOP|nr:Pheophorbide a oxygenase, chloroplastic [Frankliniella fusca]
MQELRDLVDYLTCSGPCQSNGCLQRFLVNSTIFWSCILCFLTVI